MLAVMLHAYVTAHHSNFAYFAAAATTGAITNITGGGEAKGQEEVSKSTVRIMFDKAYFENNNH